MRYRVIVYELDGEQEEEAETIIMDAEGEAFQAVVGTEREGRMRGERIVGGSADLCKILAELIADNPLDLTQPRCSYIQGWPANFLGYRASDLETVGEDAAVICTSRW